MIDNNENFINDYRKYHKKIFETNKCNKEYSKKIEKLVKKSRIIKYPKHKEAYEYVDRLFKSSNVKDIEICIVRLEFLREVYGDGCDGVFCSLNKKIFVSMSKKSFPIDEIIVHELIHYVHDKEELNFKDPEMKEEVAYGWTIGYLREKGHSDDHIINNIIIYYYLNLMEEKAIEKFMKLNPDVALEFKKSNVETP